LWRDSVAGAGSFVSGGRVPGGRAAVSRHSFQLSQGALARVLPLWAAAAKGAARADRTGVT
jgi:hypothetical protein